MKKFFLLLIISLLFPIVVSAYITSPDDRVTALFAKANQGDANAQNDLGNAYYSGDGISKDYSQAVFGFKKAAEQGNKYAQYNMGLCYDNGRGVPQDKAEAVKWYRKAAEQGYASAQNNLGVCYEYGQGVQPDYEQAFSWYKKAAAQEHEKAKSNLNKLEEKMGNNSLAQNTTTTTNSNTNRTNTTTPSTSISTTSSPKYNDVATFDLKGNVKKCKLSNGDAYEFDSNGKYLGSKVKYDEEGRISEIGNASYKYDSSGRVKIYEFSDPDFFFYIKKIYFYDTKGQVVKEILDDEFDKPITYSNYKYDSHGNWIFRQYKNSRGYIGTERRTIEYY